MNVFNSAGDTFLGNQNAVALVTAALLSSSNVIISGLPGTGKTTLARAASQATGMKLRRVQGTSELWPSDIVGGEVWNPGTGDLLFRPGPVFCDVLLVDEINRIPPRAQSALLEAMAEGQVTVGSETHLLPQHFTIIATQNENSPGVFRIDSALADRFAISISVEPLSTNEEMQLANRRFVTVESMGTSAKPAGFLELRSALLTVGIAENVIQYAANLIGSVRERATPETVSTRALLDLLSVSRGMALSQERRFVVPDDVQAVLASVISHRVSSDDRLSLVDSVLKSVEVPK